MPVTDAEVKAEFLRRKWHEFLLTVGLYVIGLLAVGGGVGVAVSPAWAAVTVGGIVLGTVFIARMGGRKE
jgi:uncharacterized membrane protein